MNEDKEFLSNLQHILSSDGFEIRSAEVMKILSDKYRQTLKTLESKIGFVFIDDEEVKIFGQNFRFNDLRKLILTFNSVLTKQPIDDCLSLIGHNCPKLSELTIISLSMSKSFLTIFYKFKVIQKLKIMFLFGNEMENIECFKHCPHLKELNIFYPQLTEDVFTNIQSSLPKLQSLLIETKQKFSDSFINSFHSMKFIQKVMIFDPKIKNHKKYWYFGKCLSEVMSSPMGKNVIRVTDNCGLIEYN